MTITYFHHETLVSFKITVKLDGRIIGSIHRRLTNDGSNSNRPQFEYVYRTKSGHVGQTFPTLEAVKRSIEEV